MSNLEFAVGKRVVCVRAAAPSSVFFAPLCKGAIYTVREIRPSKLDGEIGLCLEEIINAIHPLGNEYGYHHSRFRPVRETSIDCFTKLLEKQPELVGGNA